MTCHRRGAPLVIVAALMVAALAQAIMSIGHATTPQAPIWAGGSTPCRSDPLAHVHDPDRLEIVSDCTTVSGTVSRVKFVEAYGDLKISIRPDARFLPYLLAGNDGELIVDVIPQDQPLLPRVRVGEWAAFDGAWVIDRMNDIAEILPTWHISVPGRTAPPIARTLHVHIQAPSSIAVGAPWPVSVFVARMWPGSSAPVQQVHLFAELTTDGGSGTDWRSGLTNSLGTQTLPFVTLYPPGMYRLTVHAVKGRQVGSASTAVWIHRP